MSDPAEYRDGDFVTFSEFAKANTAWSKASLRWLRFTANSNGLAKAGAFVEQGRRVLIHKPAFFKWVAGGGK